MAVSDIGSGAGSQAGGSEDDVFLATGVVSSSPPPPQGSIDGGDGFDTVDLRSVSPAGVSGDYVLIGNRNIKITSIERVLLSDFGTNNNLSLFRTGQTLEIIAGSGNDYFGGVSGNYRIFGGAGDDRMDLYGVFGTSTLGLLDGGSGNDTLFLGNQVTADLAAGTASGGNASYVISGFERIEGYAQGGLGTVAYGSDAAETFSVRSIFDDGSIGVSFDGRGGNDTLVGSRGNDNLLGGSGDDLLRGREGADQLLGGDGTDTADYSTAVSGLSVSLQNPATNTGEAVGDFYSSIENLSGSGFGDILRGDGGVNLLRGVAGDDLLVGGLGADTLDGGTGNDVMYVDDAGDVVIERAGEGEDSVYASVSYALGAGVSVELLGTTNAAGTSPINLTGNEYAQSIYGNDGVNILSGGGGNDYLVGYAGDDRLDGGAGADNMSGGTGNDVYFADQNGDWVMEAVGGGDDVVVASGSHILRDGEEIEALFAVEGTEAVTMTGNQFGQSLYGNNGSNVLFGAGGNDYLVGNAGNDRLDGGTGADNLAGGTGNDVYFVDQVGDQIFEDVGQGDDMVVASASYSLRSDAEIEALVAAEGSSAIDLTGNSFGQSIYGNAGANVLNGREGSDYLLGGAGADRFVFDSALGSTNIDRIGDFQVGTDHIALDNAIFQGLTDGTLNPGSFALGTAATDADDRIIYDSATGALYYDADGNGAGAAVQFATLQAGLGLSAGDFVVM